ncbi:MAG: hypothetical protein ACRDD8_15845 [Bacteroidales bacterium]
MIKRAVSSKELKREMKEGTKEIGIAIINGTNECVILTKRSSSYRFGKKEMELKKEEIKAVELLESLGYSIYK